MPAPVVMVHGAFCGGWVFERFRQPFEAAGHEVLAPDLKGHAPGSSRGAAAGVSMSDYARQISDLCNACDEPPILIGHSIGGLVAQLAAQRAELSGLILLAPSAPWGVAGGSMEEAASAVSLYALGAYWMQAIEPDYSLARLYSLDRMEPDDRTAVYERMVPESGLAMWQTLNWWLDPFMTTSVTPASIRAPVLALAGGKDLIHPAATVRQTAARLGAEFRLMPQMSHWIPGEPGWDEAAEVCLSWLAADRRAVA